MLMTIPYLLLSVAGLTLLIFLHELGHYVVAKRAGMKVEVFSIGFGRALLSWKKGGVTWQIGWIPVGGYVKIAGMGKEGDLEPYEVKGGFYSKSPWTRIKVALAGPFVNMVFALLLFTLIWVAGGRQRPFRESTRVIGWVDPGSELYRNGVRPGDEVTEYNGEKIRGFEDLVYATLMNGSAVSVEGNKVDYYHRTKEPYDYLLKSYVNTSSAIRLKSVGIEAPASYLIYDDESNRRGNAFFPYSPMAKSGIRSGERLVWVDGELVFSARQLSHLINERKALLTVERGGKRFLRRAPRLFVEDLCLSTDERASLSDPIYAVAPEGKARFVPYVVGRGLTVERGLSFVDQEARLRDVSRLPVHSSVDAPLQPGDRIIAVDGAPVITERDLVKALQTRRIWMIVEEKPKQSGSILWKEEDRIFEKSTEWGELLPIVQTIGDETPLQRNGPFRCLTPVSPLTLKDLISSVPAIPSVNHFMRNRLREIGKISRPQLKRETLRRFHEEQNRLTLGVRFQDRLVTYNPPPPSLFFSLCKKIIRGFIVLFHAPPEVRQEGAGGRRIILP
ncbi:MAG: site-2 protease family protein, partial [Simkaniaceae bacterium]|nr:site-2 protease family protein [Simkaniaceae bacterium]